jgi:hypothetical protein
MKMEASGVDNSTDRQTAPGKINIDWTDPRSRLNGVIAAMSAEYEADQHCDYQRINRLIEEAAEIVMNEIGGRAQLDKLAEAFNGRK